MIVLVPILLPAVQEMGVDLIHFGVIVSVGTVVGLVSPPVGPGPSIAMIESNTPLRQILRWITPFLIAIGVSMVIINAWPALSTYLPKVLGLL